VAAEPALTLEAFLQLPEQEPALEYEEGRTTPKVSPQGQHSRLQGAFVQLVNVNAERRRLALALPELRFSAARRSYVPDVAVYRWERIPRTAQGEIANRFTTPPDVAVEIVSPGQQVSALVRRCIWYVAHGVEAALLVDPDDRSVVLFRPGASPEALQGAAAVDLSAIVPGLRPSVDDLFAALRLA
jgi:Uma2 family endonuclease